MLPDTDTDLRRDLARHKAFATGLLILMLALLGVGYALPPGLSGPTRCRPAPRPG